MNIQYIIIGFVVYINFSLLML